MLALVDCNGFYASCEQIFRPELRNQPVVVLSNNDGFIVARSKEAKALGVPDLEAYFKVKPLLNRHRVSVFSSNYPLYGDISQRVMRILSEFAPRLEIYSIDEMFLALAEKPEALDQYGQIMRQTLWRQVCIPVSVGIAPTKTLAKLANRAAKTHARYQGVCVLTTEAAWCEVLAETPVVNLWGIGKQCAQRLARMQAFTGLDFIRLPNALVRQRFNVSLARTHLELQGIPCFALAEHPAAKQQIYCTRSFGIKLTELAPIQQAMALYATRAAEKLRRQASLATTLQVFLQTSPHDPNPYYRACIAPLPYPTDDTRVIIQTAQQALQSLYRAGKRFLRAGVGLIELQPQSPRQRDLFHPGQSPRADQMMQTLDQINRRFGSGTAFFAAQGLERPWRMRQSYRSPAYTTRWDQLPVARA